MPHFILEYSANVEEHASIEDLVETVHSAALSTGVFPLGGLRTRCARREIYKTADGHPDNMFVHLVARIRHGRPLETRMEAGELVFSALCDHLEMLATHRPIAISFEIQEIDKDTSWKKNNLHKAIEERTQ